MIEIPFVGQSYKLDALDVSAQRCVNLLPEVYQDKNVKTVMSLRSTAGLSLFATMTNGENVMRALYQTSTGVFFAVRGSGVSTFSELGVETNQFSITTGLTKGDSNIVRMADNGVNMLLVDGTTSGYVYNLSTNIATVITDPDFPAGTHCAILDGFYLVNKPNSTLVLYSAVDDPTNWSSLSSLSKEGSSDHVNALIVSNRRIWVFGSQSYEVFYNTGDSNNQFLRMEGTYHNIGCQAPDSLAEDGKSVYWLGSNAQGFGEVYKSVGGGFDGVAISTQPIERAIQSYSVTNDAEGYCYQQDGHNFYQLTFPTENVTWVYDLQTGMWHEKSYRNIVLGQDERHRSRVQGFFNGKNYVGDYDNGNIYEISQTTYTDNGDIIIRKRISPVVWNALERVFYKSFQLDIESGVGLDGAGQGTDPQIIYSHSNDGGHTYTNDTFLSAGKIGEYKKRVKINRLGQSRDRVFRITYSEPTPFAILNAHVEM